MSATSERNTTYHGTDAAYVLPNDTPEHVRLEHQSIALNKMMHDTPFHALLKEPKRLLDIGCGTGAMTVQLAHAYPEAKVYGLDLSPVPPIHAKPENVEYVVGNFRDLAGKAADFQWGSFDYVFHRLLFFGMTDWPGYVSDVHSSLASGGWAEMHDPNFRWYNAQDEEVSTSWKWHGALHSALSAKGIDLDAGAGLEDWMRGAGFEYVSVREYKWTFGEAVWDLYPDSEAAGVFSTRELRFNLVPMLEALVEGSGYSGEEVREMQREMVATLDMPVGGHVKYFVVTGRKA
ncbi:hypothetical protein LTR08_009277 [Meristemomyces frigidus]|nr:hypothetical protein LTR08_009277 [Meristemomyces frigidus]